MPGLPAFGTLLKMGDGATPVESFATIANVMTIGGPEYTKDMLEVTSHDSPGGWKEFVGSLKDGGTLSLDINFDPANTTHVALLQSLLDESQPTNWQLVFPDPAHTTWTIPAMVQKFGTSAPHDGKLGASVDLKIAGQPTLGS